MVGRLLERYALSMEEIDVREERCVQVEVPIGGKRRRPIDACVTAIARFCDCKVWVSRDTVVPSYVFFGFDADTAMASYLFTVIDRAMATSLTAFRTAQPRLRGVDLRGASRSFQQGSWVTVRCPRDYDSLMRNAGGQWEPGSRRWLIERRRIGPVIRTLERSVDPLLYPIVAPDYAKVRSGLAKKIGLGRLPDGREASALLEVKERADNEAPSRVTRNTTGL